MASLQLPADVLGIEVGTLLADLAILQRQKLSPYGTAAYVVQDPVTIFFIRLSARGADRRPWSRYTISMTVKN